VDAVKTRPRNLVIGAVLGLILGGATIRLVTGGSDNSVAKLSTKTTAQFTIPLAKSVTGMKLPTATFKAFDGALATFAALASKPVVVNVWSYTCGPCIAEMPDFEKVHQTWGDRVAIIGMNSEADSESKAKEFAAKTGVTYPLWHDTESAFVNAFSIASFPATIVANADGVIVWQSSKTLTAEALTSKLKELFP
jgi:cytochrome c biogenesis protein CcmG, thiol:disulfide interchange protein DsbE